MSNKTSLNNNTTTTNNQNNAEVRVTNQAKVREIIEKYIDNSDVKVLDKGRKVVHPLMRGNRWQFESGFPEESSILKIVNKPHGLQKVKDMAKAAVKKYLRSCSLEDNFTFMPMPYYFKILKEAKAYLSTDDFSWLLRVAWEVDDFVYYEDGGIDPDEILDLLKSCNPQAFMTDEEWEDLQKFTPSSVDVYRNDGPDAFIWAYTPTVAIGDTIRYGEFSDYEGCMASIAKEDIFAAIQDYNYHYGFILNPDKLRDIEYISDLRDYCDRDELDEEDWDGYDDEDE